jgi:hypothetical protein
MDALLLAALYAREVVEVKARDGTTMTAMVPERPAGERRARRAQWPVRVYRLGEGPGDDLSGDTTPAQRLAMMWPLAVEAWAVAGRALPSYRRHELPLSTRRTTAPRDRE